MEVSNEKYGEILEKGLILDHYFLLCKMKRGEKLNSSKRVQGFINLLSKKGYLISGTLTEKAMLLVEDCVLSKPSSTGVDVGSWVEKVHKRCKSEIFALTGTYQIRARVEKKTYPFLPNVTDMAKKLGRVIEIYKLKDFEKIEECLINHIRRCNTAKEWLPLMQYYILKDGLSQLVTDMEDDGVVEVKKEFEI